MPVTRPPAADPAEPAGECLQTDRRRRGAADRGGRRRADGKSPRLRITVPDSGRPLEAYERDALLNAAVDSHDFSRRRGWRAARPDHRAPAGPADGRRLRHQTGASQGNTLWISLPLAGEVWHRWRTWTRPAAGTHAPADRRRQRHLPQVLVQQCSGWGLDVTRSPPGRKRWPATDQSPPEYFDVVLLDQDMPGMTGMRLASKIRRSSLNHDILLIMLTGMKRRAVRSSPAMPGSSASWPNRWPATPSRTTLADELAQRQAGSQHRPAPQRSPCLRWV